MLGALLSALFGVSMIQLAEPFTRQVLHEGAGKYGLLVAGYGVGAITGSIITVARGDAFRRSTLTMLGFAVFIAGELTFGLAPVYAVALLGLFGIGLAQVLAMVSCQTAVQVNVDEDYRGRVLSIYVMCFFAGTPVGALIGGIVAEVIGLRATVVGSAALLASRSGWCCSVTRASVSWTKLVSASTTSPNRRAATWGAPTSTPPPTSSSSRWSECE